MTDRSVFDFAVIGAGIAGASVAARLADTASVVLLERESQPGYHSTGRSAAMFMESYGPSMVRALTRASRAFYLQPPAGFTDTALLSDRGALYLALQGQQHTLQALRDELADTCPGLRTLDRDAVLALVPCLRAEQVHSGLLDPMAMDIDVHALHQGFLRLLRRGGGTVYTKAEVTQARRGDGLWQLHLADGRSVSARALVNAAGAWADEVGALCGAPPIGLVPHRRSAFTFRPPDGVDASRWPVVSSMDETWYIKPDAGVLLGSPANADPTVPHDVVPEEIDIATAIHEIESVTTLQIRRPLRTWAGLRSFVPDGELVIGWDPSCDGLFWLAAQGGYGIQSAPGASELAAALLLNRPVPDALLAQGVVADAVSPHRLR
ncbi:MAG: FAD-binding oxidoreductase [Rhodoferax sp.]|nr:FAD-binding oxidoreductase [Rhodoferax sp.]